MDSFSGRMTRPDRPSFREAVEVIPPGPAGLASDEIQIGPEIDIVLSHENELETQEITFDTQFEFETGDDIGFEVKNTTENSRHGSVMTFKEKRSQKRRL